MRTRIEGESRERLRQLLTMRGRPLGATPGPIDLLVQTATMERWAIGDAIMTRDAEGERVGMVVVGAVRIVCETPRGKRVGVCFVPPGRFVTGWWPGEEGAARRELHMIGHDPLGTIVAWWGARTIADVLAQLSPGQAMQLMTTVWRGTTEVVREKCHLLGFCLRDRVLDVLTALARDFGRPHPDGLRIDLRVTHADLASAAVGSRANVTRALEELRNAGAVAVEQHRLIVTHRGLAALSPDPPSGTGTTGCARVAAS
jgi:CRP/FNR family transcriptional regulator